MGLSLMILRRRRPYFLIWFKRKQRNEKLTLPQIWFLESKLTALVFRFHEIWNCYTILMTMEVWVLLGFSLISEESCWYDFPIFLMKVANILSLFLKKAAEVLSPKVTVILRKCAREGSPVTCLRVGNVTTMPIRGNGSSLSFWLTPSCHHSCFISGDSVFVGQAFRCLSFEEYFLPLFAIWLS